jgi:hypothetical protein
MGDDTTNTGIGRPGRPKVAALRNVLIAVPPVAVLVTWVAASVHAHGATGDTDQSWAPIVWPLMSALWTFPFAVGTVVLAVLLRRSPGRVAAIVASSVVAALGVLPFVGAVSVFL